VNINTRGATSTLSTSQLALVDGRSIYLDFYGMVMWDFVPSNPREIKRIEVIRGPASAVWGANAMSGVVNVITKTPRELAAEAGSSLTIGVGGFQRSAQGVDRDAGSLFYVNGSHAQAVNDKVAYKVSAGFFTQDALPRPVGTIPNSFNTPYPDYTNEGTSQPKFDARVDYSLADNATLTFNGGVAGTEGIIHTGIGPFDIDRGSYLSYLSAKYQKGARRVAFFTNLLTANSTNLLSRGPTGAFLPLGFDTKTFDVEAGDSRAIGTHNAVTFGGNYRHNTFDVSLAPNGKDRNEGGAFVQDEVFLGPYVRWVVGGRVDKFSSISDAVFSPRTSLLLKPNANNSIRFSFNKAFRAPSFINNNLQTSVLNEVNLSPISPLLARFIFPVGAVGNHNLKQESLTAYEVGYTGLGNKRATVTASVDWNKTKDAIFFTPASIYSPASPPPTWPAFIPTFVLSLLPTPLPSSYTQSGGGEGQRVRAGDRGRRHARRQRLRELLVSGRSGHRRLRPARGQLAGQQPVQRRLQREPRPLPGQSRRELQRGGLLAGRTRPALRGDDRRLHAGERRHRGTVGAREGGDQPQDHQHRQLRDPAAHLRRRAAPSGGGRGALRVLDFDDLERNAGQLVVPERLEHVVRAVAAFHLEDHARHGVVEQRHLDPERPALAVDALDAEDARVVAHPDHVSVEGHEPGVGVGAERGIGGGDGQRV
jgi:hypothetical protein